MAFAAKKNRAGPPLYISNSTEVIWSLFAGGCCVLRFERLIVHDGKQLQQQLQGDAFFEKLRGGGNGAKIATSHPGSLKTPKTMKNEGFNP